MKSLPNLIKPQFIHNQPNSKRMIDSNVKMEALWKAAEKKKSDIFSPDEFQEGIFAEPVEVISPEELLEDAQNQAERTLKSANEEAEQILILANQERERILQEAKNEGHMEGYRDGVESANKEYDQKLFELAKEKDDLEAHYQAQLDQMESQIVDTLLNVIERVLDIQIEELSPVVLGLVKKSIRHIDNAKEFKVFLNQKQLDYFHDHMAEIQEQVGNSKFIEGLLDNSLADEQCRIETDYGTYHCGYDTYYKNLIKDIQTLSL